jgi:hypothetical protein
MRRRLEFAEMVRALADEVHSEAEYDPARL